MADTRCADPELQLDVDIMILEYTLYQAIRALFESLSSGAHNEIKATEAARLVIIFDSFVRLFNQNHPSHAQLVEFHLQLDILELLVLLSSRSSIVPPQFADAMSDGLSKHAMRNLEARRKWIAAREKQNQRLGKQPAYSDADVAQDVEQQIYSAWKTQEAKQPVASQHPIQALLFDLLSRFMDISTTFMALIDQYPNDNWIELACEFMLQASLESLRLQLRNRGADRLPQLDDCFAWGYVGVNSDSTADGSAPPEARDLVNSLFLPSPDSGLDVNAENPSWTRRRMNFLSEFSIAFDASSQSQSSRLERLENKYPPGIFQDKLITALRSIWDNICGETGYGKPVLVQIEEGHLKSLDIDGAEFDVFLAKVGLEKHDDGYVRIIGRHGLPGSVFPSRQAGD